MTGSTTNTDTTTTRSTKGAAVEAAGAAGTRGPRDAVGGGRRRMRRVTPTRPAGRPLGRAGPRYELMAPRGPKRRDVAAQSGLRLPDAAAARGRRLVTPRSVTAPDLRPHRRRPREGRRALRGRAPPPWEHAEGDDRYRSLKETVGQLAMAARQWGGRQAEQVDRAVEILARARRELYQLLAEV